MSCLMYLAQSITMGGFPSVTPQRLRQNVAHFPMILKHFTSATSIFYSNFFWQSWQNPSILAPCFFSESHVIGTLTRVVLLPWNTLSVLKCLVPGIGTPLIHDARSTWQCTNFPPVKCKSSMLLPFPHGKSSLTMGTGCDSFL